MKRRLASLMLLLHVGCSGQPLPADKAAYAGTWEGVGFELTITPDGGCSYRRQSGSGRTEVNGPIRGFEGDDFVVGLPLLHTTFDVTAPPHEVDGQWAMTVDGVELVRR
jgi:hypothetical protein